MSGTGEVVADFAGEERAFRIRLGEIRRIESKCGDVGIGEVLRRLSRCVYAMAKLGGIEALASGVEIRADDVRTSIYEGLKGGGMADGVATRLVREHIDDRGVQGLLDHAPVALSVLMGSQEAPPGEPKAGTGESLATPLNPSTSNSSTESEPQSA